MANESDHLPVVELAVFGSTVSASALARAMPSGRVSLEIRHKGGLHVYRPTAAEARQLAAYLLDAASDADAAGSKGGEPS